MRRTVVAVAGAVAASAGLLVPSCADSSPIESDDLAPTATTAVGRAEGETEPGARLTDEQNDHAVDIATTDVGVSELMGAGGGVVTSVAPLTEGDALDVVGAVVEIQFDDGPVTIPAGLPAFPGVGEAAAENVGSPVIVRRTEPQPDVNGIFVHVDFLAGSVTAISAT